MNLSKKATPRMGRTGSAGIMAKNFLKNLDAGLLIDRTQPSKTKCAKKRIGAPNSLLKYSRPRPTATESLEGKPTGREAGGGSLARDIGQ